MNAKDMNAFDITPDTTRAVDHAIASRRSVRAFLPTPVPRATVEEILRLASRAPSGTNSQPWRVHALAGGARDALAAALCAAHDAHRPHDPNEYNYYPPEWCEPYISRRRKVGADLYGILGIAKGDTHRMHAQWGRNNCFFDAPVVLLFSIERCLGVGSLLDYGMFMQNIMTAARARGLDTCCEESLGRYHSIVRQHIGLADSEMFVCGMALGYADPNAPENAMSTEREPVERFAQLCGFE